MQVLGDDRFELRRLVGEGSYGEVYQAYDHETAQHVAIKLMFRAGRDAEARFEREAELLAGLAHPNIVRYVAHGRADQGQSYLVMEWLQGETLEFRLRRKQMTAEDVIAVARGAASGLSFAAQQGIVHRDIKPANLFLVARDCSQLKILDLGLARRRTQDQRLTGTGGLVGTPLYMSPEQARGARDVDPRSDVFSLGSVLYECLCIDRPFEGTHPVATMAKICMEEPVPIEVNTPEVPSRLAKLVHSMLHKDRDRRPAYRWITLELSMIEQAESHSPSPAQAVQVRSLQSQGEQRVMCAVFVRGAGRVSDSGEDLGLERELRAVAERFAARRERLLDGSQILVIETHANAIDQALSSAQCALALRALIGPQAPLAVCTGKARVEHGRPLLGELLERGVRLLLETPSGAIRVDEASAALLEARFELGPERALLRERRGGEAPRTLLGQPTRFVGRDRELSQLSLSFRECVEEQVARPVLVTAAPGAGKSRLRYELLESLRAHGEPFTLLTARGDAMRSGKPLDMLASALRSWADDGALRTRLASVVPPARAPILAAFLGELLGLRSEEPEHAQLTAARRDPALLTERMQECWLEWLRALSEQSAILLCVEDLHWSDPASVRALDNALRSLAQRPLMVLAFARPEVRETFRHLWEDRDLTELRLPKLTARHCERVLDAVLPSANAELQQALIERADGNPFFLEELVRALHAGETQLPDTVLGVVQARLDALGDDLKRVIRAASVFGAQFHAEGVRALLHERRDLNPSLRLLAEREVIFPRALDEYGFRHALIRDAAYLLLDGEQRENAHRAAAEWLCERKAPAATLADHWERAALPERAAPYYRDAAVEALDAGSMSEVVRWGERAIACGARATLLGEVASAIAFAHSSLLQEPEAVRTSELALAHLGSEHPAWWRAAEVGCLALMRLDREPEASVLFEQMAAALPQPPTATEHITAVSYVVLEATRLMFHRLGERALSLLPPDVPDSLDGRARGHMFNAYSFRALLTGDKEASLHHARAAADAFRRVGATYELTHSLVHVGYLSYELGALEEAEWVLLEHRRAMDAMPDLSERGYGAFYLGQVQARRGHLDEAEALLVESLQCNDRAHCRPQQIESRAALAELATRRGQYERARELLDEALRIDNESLHAVPYATVYLAYARYSLARSEPEAALGWIERAMALCERHGDLIDARGRIQPVHVACLVACGKQAEARLASGRANAWLDKQLATIKDPALRDGYLQLSENQQTCAFAEAV